MKKIISIVAVCVVGIVGFLSYTNFKMGEISKEVEKSVNKAKDDFAKYVSSNGLGTEFNISGNMTCDKEGWIMPSIVCKSKEMNVGAKNVTESIEVFSLRDFSLVLKGSMAMLMGKEADFQVLGKFELGESMRDGILENIWSAWERRLAKEVFEWIPDSFNLSLKTSKKDDKSFVVSSNLVLTSNVMKNIFSGKVQYDAVNGEKISLFDFLDQFFSLRQSENWRETWLTSDVTLASEKETLKAVERVIEILGESDRMFRQMTPKTWGNTFNAGLDMIVIQCRDCKQIPHFATFVDYAKNMINVFSGENKSTTLSFVLKEGANTNSQSFQAIRDVIKHGLQGNLEYEAILEFLKEYDVKVSKQPVKEEK